MARRFNGRRLERTTPAKPRIDKRFERKVLTGIQWAERHLEPSTTAKLKRVAKTISFSVPHSYKNKILISLSGESKQCDIDIEGSNVVARFLDFSKPNLQNSDTLRERHRIDQAKSREEFALLMMKKINSISPARPYKIAEYKFTPSKPERFRAALSFAINEAIDELAKEQNK